MFHSIRDDVRYGSANYHKLTASRTVTTASNDKLTYPGTPTALSRRLQTLLVYAELSSQKTVMEPSRSSTIKLASALKAPSGITSSAEVLELAYPRISEKPTLFSQRIMTPAIKYILLASQGVLSLPGVLAGL